MSDSGRAVQKSERNDPALQEDKSIDLNARSTLSLTGLSDDQIAELKKQHAQGLINVQRKAEELKVDVGALDAALNTFNDQTARATEAGSSATITHTQTTSAGRTEVVIGNTDKAKSGKISRSARGEADRTVVIVGIIAAAIVIAALILA